LIAAPTASAAFNFTFGTTSTGDLAPGQTRIINVFLTYDGVGPNTLANPGVAAANWAIREATGGGSVSLVPDPPVLGVNAAGNADFGPPNGVIAPLGSTAPPAVFPPVTGFTNVGGLRESVLAGAVNSSGPGNVGGSPTSLLLGSFTVTGGTSGPVTIQAGRLDPTRPDNFVDGSATSFDLNAAGGVNINAGTLAFTVAIPEPGSMALVGMAAFGFAGAVWRRRRAARTETPETVA
jgi:hypothetical protein